MKLVHWEFQGLHVPMVEDDNRELYCTSKAICGALGMKEGHLWKITSLHSKELSELSLTNSKAKDFLQENRIAFGITRMRKDMRIWSEDDMLTFAFHSGSDKSMEFRKNLRQFIKRHAARNYVTQEQYQELDDKLGLVLDVVKRYYPAANKTASLAGSMLRAQRETKHLRNLH